jgi:hypothetical protein
LGIYLAENMNKYDNLKWRAHGMSVDGEFKRLMADDRLCADVLKAVRENDTAALRRLGFGGFAQYAGRLSELMTVSVRGGLDFSEDFGELMRQVNSPARYAHHLVNECGTAVQTALDERQGLRLRVVQPPYNDGRTKGLIGDALSRETPEQGKEALATGLGTEVKDAGNEFMKQNAEQRSRAGFTVTVERTGGSNCCPWCADRVGKWELKNAPKDVFGVHDKCTCMVAYTNSRGVSTQARAAAGKWLWHPVEQNAPSLHVLTGGEKRGAGEPVRLAKNPGAGAPKMLTGGANGGIIELDIKKLLMQKIADGEISTQINPEVQNRHFLGTKERQEFLDRGIEKSYFLPGVTLEMLQDFLSKKVGTGKLYINRKGNIEEIFNFGKDVAYDTMWNRKTPYMKVLYSKKRTHFFPYSPLGGEIE